MLNSAQHRGRSGGRARRAGRAGELDFVMLGPEQLANAETHAGDRRQPAAGHAWSPSTRRTWSASGGTTSGRSTCGSPTWSRRARPAAGAGADRDRGAAGAGRHHPAAADARPAGHRRRLRPAEHLALAVRRARTTCRRIKRSTTVRSKSSSPTTARRWSTRSATRAARAWPSGCSWTPTGRRPTTPGCPRPAQRDPGRVLRRPARRRGGDQRVRHGHRQDRTCAPWCTRASRPAWTSTTRRSAGPGGTGARRAPCWSTTRAPCASRGCSRPGPASAEADGPGRGGRSRRRRRPTDLDRARPRQRVSRAAVERVVGELAELGLVIARRRGVTPIAPAAAWPADAGEQVDAAGQRRQAVLASRIDCGPALRRDRALPPGRAARLLRRALRTRPAATATTTAPAPVPRQPCRARQPPPPSGRDRHRWKVVTGCGAGAPCSPRTTTSWSSRSTRSATAT